MAGKCQSTGMGSWYIYMLLVLFNLTLSAQEGFKLIKNKKRNSIPFELVNNLPVIKVNINGSDFSFLLDTGVNATILFSPDSLTNFNPRAIPVQINGLGPGSALDGFKAAHNIIKVGNAIDRNHELYLIFDPSLNFSPRMGVPINGILGNSFFRDFVVKIDYSRRRIIFYESQQYSYPSCKKCEDIPLNFYDQKPYINLIVADGTTKHKVTLLVDSGSSDALWLFDQGNFIKENPKNYFPDILGLGLSGDISGIRSRIPGLELGKYNLKEVSASFPEPESVRLARKYEERDGSIGGGILSRFNIIFDYAQGNMRLMKNRNFKKAFHYNMSGITLEHSGMDWLIEEFHFSLVPRYVVVDIRENSPAQLAGVQLYDEILSINGKPNYKYKLYELIGLFSSEEGRRITLEIRRGEGNIKVKFYLKDVFQ